jgi:hypothetical protein
MESGGKVDAYLCCRGASVVVIGQHHSNAEDREALLIVEVAETSAVGKT